MRGLSLFVGLLAAASLHAAPPPITILMVGDSTMASYASPPADRPTLTGWGQVFGEMFTPGTIVNNRALSGRSSKSYITEGRWNKALATPCDYVFIQFGHNDQAGKPRSTDAKTDFRDYLKQYIADARRVKMRPILVTPVARRTFDAQGRATTTLTPYADAMKAVGKETGTPVIDLHASSLALFNRLGDKGSADFSPSASDRTHFSKTGAQAIAKLVATELQSLKVGGLEEAVRLPAK